MAIEVATVVALRAGRVLAVSHPGDGRLALPGGKLQPGESPSAAAVRELREETGIVTREEALIALDLRVEVAGGAVALTPFALLNPPRRAAPAELSTRWIGLERLHHHQLAPAMARSVHAALARTHAVGSVPDRLVRWWADQRTDLPWRRTRDPYAVLVCEVMSQQTQIERVRSFWEGFMLRWPTIEALSRAPLSDVLRAWQGLGYPRRARDLHAAATLIAEHGWPPPERLTELPGVGPYTAEAIRCFALEHAVLPRDANVRRVLERRFPGGVGGGEVDPWSLGGALMDLGRMHCRARPRCDGCPLRPGCMVALEPDGWDPARRPRRQSPYAGSLRQRRAELLRAALADQRPAAHTDWEASSSLLADRLVALADGALVAPRASVGGAR